MKTHMNNSISILFITVLISLFSGMLVRGQDIIVKKNGDEINAKVEQVLDKEIMYRKFENLTGPIYSIAKADVFMIKYENGSKDVFESQPATAYTQPQTSRRSITGSDIAPAKAGAIINYSVAAPVMAFGLLSAFTEDDDMKVTYGTIAAAIFGVGTPVGAIITGAARRNTGVEGSLGLRIGGWVSYGCALADAVSMIALQDEVGFGTGPILACTILGTLSTVLFGLDASLTIKEAKALQSGVSLMPTIKMGRDFTGKPSNTVGFVLNF